MEIFSCGVRRRRRSAPVNTSTIFSLRLVLNIVPRLPLKLRGAKCLDLQGANLVLKLDRLGRDNIDVQTTITNLTERGIKVVSLDLPVSDLTSPEGKLMLQLMGAFAEFERNRIRERTQEGLQRAKAEGKALGRPVAVDTTEAVQRAKGEGLSQSKVSDKLGISLATVKRHWNK
ncbi:recombinase family protein [Aeromonas veronii]|uniref:Resolvase/invertase-type recombinase catalytic domain-containing protein n=1 Tax=Aeromonas veronii TaxID=654 RepID=A0ABY3MFJ3_AERVE|nr:resolvase [Aeromonas veronii]RDU78013.1 resolvase [Aeromonas veronii]TEY43643.1 hypothetical protein CIG14_22300 [Aeromonas veronii]TEY71135.1 hypothetical protein CIG16_21845 [Aeromonas veronii]TYD39855.1 hypothetical protein CJF23_22110 [Aeromonas veronii]